LNPAPNPVLVLLEDSNYVSCSPWSFRAQKCHS
jgi:hypothetical protein